MVWGWSESGGARWGIQPYDVPTNVQIWLRTAAGWFKENPPNRSLRPVAAPLIELGNGEFSELLNRIGWSKRRVSIAWCTSPSTVRRWEISRRIPIGIYYWLKSAEIWFYGVTYATEGKENDG